MKDFTTALALALVVEGILYALFPDAMRRMIVRVAAVPANIVRVSGLAAACVGVATVWLIRG